MAYVDHKSSPDPSLPPDLQEALETKPGESEEEQAKKRNMKTQIRQMNWSFRIAAIQSFAAFPKIISMK